MTLPPTVSVVIPMFNRALTVGRAIKSVLAQTYEDFELIVIDDGSADQGADVARGFADQRISLISLAENRGAGAARNEGIRHARGRIITFLDSDDVYYPHKLATVVAKFEHQPELGALIDSSRKVYPTDARQKLRLNPELNAREELLLALFNRRICKATSGISVDRDAAISAGMFDEGLKKRQDFDFLIRLIGATQVVSSSEVTWEKTYTRDSISADAERSIGSFLDFWDRHPEYYARPEYRPGFSADLWRYLYHLLMRGKVRSAIAGATLVAERIGWRSFLRSFLSGATERGQLKRDRMRATQRRRLSAQTEALDRVANVGNGSKADISSDAEKPSRSEFVK